MPVLLPRIAFLLHAAVEAPAAATFLLAPARQLSPALLANPSAAAEITLLLHNLGGLLAVTVALSIVMAMYGTEGGIGSSLRGAILLCLAAYHVFPSRRAFLRRTRGIGLQGPQGRTLGGPAVHLLAHVACFAVLSWAGIADLSSVADDARETGDEAVVWKVRFV